MTEYLPFFLASNEIKAYASRRPDLLAYWLVAERLATYSIQRFLLIPVLT